jgi:predicted aldo/keto reductase-like oxidoreductase
MKNGSKYQITGCFSYVQKHKIRSKFKVLGFNRFESANVCRKYFYAKPEDFQNKHIAFIMTQK